MSNELVGQESLERFVDTINNTINNNAFDVILAASDSGNLATYITSVIYKNNSCVMPPVTVFPVFRYVDKERTILFDNTVSSREYPTLRGKNLGNVLFVDDEIWHGVTLRGVLDIIGALHATIHTMTLVAEDGGFSPKEVEDAYNIKIRYVSPRDRVKEIYNAFSYIVPDTFVEAVRSALPDDESINCKQIMCILLGLPVKARKDDIPYFSSHLTDVAYEKVENFDLLQQDFVKWFNRQIVQYIE